MDERTRNILTMAGIGLVAGWLASWLVGSSKWGILGMLASGLLGSFVGGMILNALRVDLGIRNEIAYRVVSATIGAVVVVILARIIA